MHVAKWEHGKVFSFLEFYSDGYITPEMYKKPG